MSTNNTLLKYEKFDSLCQVVQSCTKCTRMCDSQRVLNRSGGTLNPDIMFIGEAPGRLGADASGIPFHGDKSGHNFEELLDFAKIDRSKIFVTNSVLCNPRDESGNNSTPTKLEIQNCAFFLKEQIEIINPKIVVTLGSTALESTRYVLSHSLILKEHVRTANQWLNRILIPLYHPGQRAMLHRSFANQRSDYQFVSEQSKKLGKSANKVSTNINYSVMEIVRRILSKLSVVDYFKLHKLFYLIEYLYCKKFNTRLTTAYIVRQKDGPYCTDLHFQKILKALPEAGMRQIKGNLVFTYTSGLFEQYNSLQKEVDIESIIDGVIVKYGNLSNSEIKTKVYLTDPMRSFLKLEKENGLNLYNAPIQFDI